MYQLVLAYDATAGHPAHTDIKGCSQRTDHEWLDRYRTALDSAHRDVRRGLAHTEIRETP